jgi:glutamine amidotransferase PdxT
MTTTFHPELSTPDALHRHFLALVEEARNEARSA